MGQRGHILVCFICLLELTHLPPHMYTHICIAKAHGRTTTAMGILAFASLRGTLAPSGREHIYYSTGGPFFGTRHPRVPRIKKNSHWILVGAQQCATTGLMWGAVVGQFSNFRGPWLTTVLHQLGQAITTFGACWGNPSSTSMLGPMGLNMGGPRWASCLFIPVTTQCAGSSGMAMRGG